jgi:hypothetical protein
MDKIEKLEYAFGLPPIVDKNLFDKINEIIDYLNQSQKQPEGYTFESEGKLYKLYGTSESQKQPEGLEEETEAEKHEREFLGKLKYGAELIDEYEEREQPEKQPEGEITAGDVFQLRRLEAFAEDYKELKKSMNEPEKQEECIKDR